MTFKIQGSYRNLTVVFQTFPGQNYFFFPDFSKHFVNKTLQNWLLNYEICYTMYSSILTSKLASNF